jgi:hypothetical protein
VPGARLAASLGLAEAWNLKALTPNRRRLLAGCWPGVGRVKLRIRFGPGLRLECLAAAVQSSGGRHGGLSLSSDVLSA